MTRAIVLGLLGLVLSFSALANDLALEGFNKRFSLVRDESGKVTAVKLKKVISRFTIMPFIEQLKADLKIEQQSFNALTDEAREQQIDNLLYEMGYNIHDKNSDGYEEALRTKESFLNIKNIDVETSFAKLDQRDFWKEFEAKLNEAFLYIDPTVLANLEDSRFFYKKQVVYKVIAWALEQAKKRFSDIPILNIASFVIVRVHDMIMEQRHFHHNMLLHYFEQIPESKLGMTKEEIDRTVSSIYEYRIDAQNVLESNRAASDWINYGMNNFYRTVRAGNERVRTWASGSSMNFSDVKKINFAFAEVTQQEARKIYHLHVSSHTYTRKPALAYNYAKPNQVKQIRTILTLSGLALGFINMPGWLKAEVDFFIKSMHVQQVRMEGALVGYFESQGDTAMIKSIYRQRANFYIVE